MSLSLLFGNAACLAQAVTPHPNRREHFNARLLREGTGEAKGEKGEACSAVARFSKLLKIFVSFS